QPARRGGGLHTGVRRGPLVGGGPAQPDRAVHPYPVALHGRRDGHQRPVPTPVVHLGPGTRPQGLAPADGVAEGVSGYAAGARLGTGRWGVGTVELELERVAHGGSVVGRVGEKVVFVTGGLPGELVRAEVTSTSKRFDRARVVEVLRPAPGRVVPPCPIADE